MLGAKVDLWEKAPELEQDPETLFHLGEAVASCQAITGTLVQYSKALTSYFTVGHIGALVASTGKACEPLRHGARTCENLDLRAIIRFLFGHVQLSGDTQVPVLLLEKPYKAAGRSSADIRTKQGAWNVLSKAFALCHKLSSDLLISDKFEWRKYIGDLDLEFDIERESWELESAGGLSPYTYSDAVDGTHSLKESERYDVGLFKHGKCQHYQNQVDSVAKMHAAS